MFIQREYCWLLQGENDGEKCILGHWGNEPPGPASSRGPPGPPITSQCQLLTLLPGVKCAQHQQWTFAASSCEDKNLHPDMRESSRQVYRIVNRTVHSESPLLSVKELPLIRLGSPPLPKQIVFSVRKGGFPCLRNILGPIFWVDSWFCAFAFDGQADSRS